MYILPNTFDNIDLFGTHIQLSVKSRYNISSLLGILLTLIAGVSLVVLFIILGKDLLHRKNPILKDDMKDNLININKTNSIENSGK